MFSNRFYGAKLAGALVVIALLGVYAAWRGDSINPKLFRCVAEPRRWDGTELWLPFGVIDSIGNGEFVVNSGDSRIRVVGAPPAGVGGLVSLYGTFRADGPRFDLMRSRVLPPHVRFRWLMEAVSVLVVIGVLANLCRHFLFRPKVLQVEGRD